MKEALICRAVLDILGVGMEHLGPSQLMHMDHFFSTFLILVFVIDPLGNIPVYLSLFRSLDKRQRIRVTTRELLFALALMLLFHFVGEGLLVLLSIPQTTVQIAGGVILFLIALRLIYAVDTPPDWGTHPPFIVPIATPLIAGPSVLTVIMLHAQDALLPEGTMLMAILSAWLLTVLVFFAAKPLYRFFTEKGLIACQRLIGLIVAIVAVQAVVRGFQGLCGQHG